MNVLHIILLAGIALHLVSAKNLMKRECANQECNSPCNAGCSSNNCDSYPCNNPPCNNNCHSQSCNSNCHSQPCNNYHSQPCSSRNNNCNQQPCDVPAELSEEKVPVLVPFPNENQTNSQSAVHSINNTNINNSTSTITLTNTINTVNNISVPISLNSTNENTISVHFEAKAAQGVTERSLWDNISSKCCLVTRPVDCGADGKNCTVERIWECSDICRGILPDIQEPVVDLQPSTTPKPIVDKIPDEIPVYQPQYRIIYQLVQQPVMSQQPVISTTSCGSMTSCGQTAGVAQQPFTYPIYQPVSSYVPQNTFVRRVMFQPQVVPVQVSSAYQPGVAIKEGAVRQPLVQTDQGALSRVLLMAPNSNYFGDSYQAAYQQQQQYNMVSTMGAPCPYSNANNIGYPSPCQQMSQRVWS